MPKVEKIRESHSGPSGSQNSLLVYIYGKKRVVGTRRDSYQLTLDACRVLFPSIPKSHQISFHTKDLDICEGQLTEIAIESWEDVVVQLRSVVVISEEAEPLEPLPSPPRKDPELYTLHFVYYDMQTLTVQLKNTTPVSKVHDLVASRFALCPSDFYMMYDGERVGGQYVGGWGASDGDQIDCYLTQVGGKPVIYVFSPEPMEALVKLSLRPEWELSAIYPVVLNSDIGLNNRGEVAWQVRTHQNGDLTELQTGLDVSYLFWEAHTLPKLLDSPPPSPINQAAQDTIQETFIPNDAVIADENAVILAVDKISLYLDASLKSLGLHTEARTSFITYWLPSFLKHKHVALRFLPQSAYEQAAPLEVSPSPDVITRIFMLFRGVEEAALPKWPAAQLRSLYDVSFWVNTVGVNPVKTLDVRLFRVVEWGGMEVVS